MVMRLTRVTQKADVPSPLFIQRGKGPPIARTAGKWSTRRRQRSLQLFTFDLALYRPASSRFRRTTIQALWSPTVTGSFTLEHEGSASFGEFSGGGRQ